MPDRGPDSHPPCAAAPVERATGLQPLAVVGLFTVYGALLLVVVSMVGSVFGLW